MSTCETCKYLGDFTKFKLGLRCLNKHNKPSSNDFKMIPSVQYSCSNFKYNDPRDRFEWDENKNELNKIKHKIGFERAFDIFHDPDQIQMPEIPDKWEKEDGNENGIEKSDGNLDPVRSKIIGNIDGKIYTFTYTFRHDLGNLTYRVISLRRSDSKERKIYEMFRNNKTETQNSLN